MGDIQLSRNHIAMTFFRLMVNQQVITNIELHQGTLVVISLAKVLSKNNSFGFGLHL